MFPGRRGAGRIFANQVKLSGVAPQICCLFGPSAAGGAYIPSFCDVVIMVEGNASMYLGSPRMAEEVIGERVTLEEMGGARMHATVSGCGDNLAADDADAIEQARALLLLPARLLAPGPADGRRPSSRSRALTRSELPDDDAAGYDMHASPRLHRRRRQPLRDQAALCHRAHHRVRPPRRPRDRRGGEQPGQQGRGALRRLGRQGGPVRVDVRRLQRPAAVPGRRARVHDRHPGRAAGHHPARGEDGGGGDRGERAQDLAWSFARPTAPASTPCAGRPSTRWRHSRCRPPRSP